MKSVKILVGSLCLCAAFSLSACAGIGQKSSDSEPTTEVTTEVETTTRIEVEAKEQKLVPKDSVTEPTQPPTFDRPVTGDFTSDDAENYIHTSLRAMKNADWETVLKYTNFGDVCRIEDDSLTDEQIIEAINSGYLDSYLNEYRESARKFDGDVILDELPKRMSQDDLDEISSLANKVLAGKIDLKLVDGYRASFGRTNGMANLYVLCYEGGDWKFDICFGLMRDGFQVMDD